MSEAYRKKHQSRQSADWLVDADGKPLGLIGPEGKVYQPVIAETGPGGGVRIPGRFDQINVNPRYPAYYKKRPLNTIVVPFGTPAINEAASTGATMSATVDADVTVGGRPTTKITITAAGTQTAISLGRGATAPLDADGQAMRTRGFFVAVRSPSNALTDLATVYVGDSTLANAYTFDLVKVGTTADGWDVFSKEMIGETTTTGTPDLSAPVRVRLRLNTVSSVQVGTIHVSPVYVLPEPSPSVVWTNDDGYAEWTWLAEQAAKRGLPISFGISKGYVGQPGYMTETEIRSLLQNYAHLHEITNHADTNDSFASVGLSAYIAAVNRCRDYLVSLGVPEKTASLHQYVQGSMDATLVAAMMSNGYLSARTVGAGNKPAMTAGIAGVGRSATKLFSIPATVNLESTITVAQAKSAITAAVKTGTAFLMGHRYATAAGTIQWIKGYDASYGALDLMDWLAERRDVDGWEIKTWGGWYDDQFSAQIPIL